MTELFPALLEKAQKAVEECLDGTGHNPISVIKCETFDIVEYLTDEEIIKLLAERPQIMENEVALQDPPPRSVLFADIAREAVAIELQKNIDTAPLADAFAEWQDSTWIPDHLSEGVERALRRSMSDRP
jgi:hypothetical protein